MKNTYKCYKN